jgi:hypothetical protein
MNIYRICLPLLFALTTALATVEACAQSTLTIGPTSFVEAGLGQQVVTVTLRLSAPTNQLVSGRFAARSSATSNATRGTSCGAGIDYIGTSGDIRILPGGEQSIDITICGDNAIEPDEHFFLLITGLTGAVCEAGTVADPTGSCLYIVQIRNDDFPTLRVVGSIVNEPTSGSGSVLLFQAFLSAISIYDATFTLSTRNGTAIGNPGKGGCDGRFDFLHKSERLTIPAGQPSANFRVTICPDLLTEGTEGFTVEISNASAVRVVNASEGALIRAN